ncbi:helix-turn-helix transcriptional regulator [Streptomyces sp. NPDC051572]|uniref:helix-turn-helix domain-containing protein n=1 Tax=Streptomyces sp. NPDC051572 TaxID=3155802 RepID=UPI00344FFE7E
MSHYRLRVERLRLAAAARGDLTSYAISKRTGVAQSTLSRLRRGIAKPAADTLLVLSSAYGVSVDDLIDRDADNRVEGDAA